MHLVLSAMGVIEVEGNDEVGLPTCTEALSPDLNDRPPARVALSKYHINSSPA